MIRLKRFLCLAIALLLVTCTACTAEKPAQDGPGTRLIALNAGKADCLLLLFEDKSYLIDSGYERTFPALLEMLRQYDITRLDGVILTHCDKDHYGSLMPLAKSDIDVNAWYAAAIYHDVKPGEHPMELAAAARGEQVTWLSAGDTLKLTGSASLTVLGPLTVNAENENNNSLVFSVETADGTLLFTGDMKLDEEMALLLQRVIPRADVLKVPFHGDNSACSDNFVRAVSPQLALISTSTKEEPDTPSAKVIKRLGLVDAQTLITQDFAQGVEITLKKGRASYTALQFSVPDHSRHVRAAIDLNNDILTLRNSLGEAISLKGWMVYSSRGETCVYLPEDAVLPANGVYKIGTRATGSEVTLKLDMKRLWHSSRYDQAVIYDAHGSVVAVTDNGMPE